MFRGIKHFHGESSLKTWIYRIAVHEASNRRRWWFRHKSREMSIEPTQSFDGIPTIGIRETLMYQGDSPFESMLHEEVRGHVEEELRKVTEPYRTTVILRDLEGMSYEEIAEITACNLGTVKSRLNRARTAFAAIIEPFID